MKNNENILNEYKKARKQLNKFSNIFSITLLILLISVIVASSALKKNKTFFIISISIFILVLIIAICVLVLLYKKQKDFHNLLYGKDETLHSTNPLFNEFIDEYYQNVFERWDELLPKNWHILDVYDHNNIINIETENKKTKTNVEIVISENKIEFVKNAKKVKDRDLTNENFKTYDDAIMFICKTLKTENFQ